MIRGASLLMILFLIGCADSRPPPTQDSTREATVVALTQNCPTAVRTWSNDAGALEAGPLTVLIAQVGAVFIEKLVDYAAAEIGKQKEKLSASSSARTRSALYRFDQRNGADVVMPRYGCVILARGTLGAKIKPVADSGAYWSERRLQYLAALGNDQESIFLVTAPKLYAEFEIHYDNRLQIEGRARNFALQAHFIDYAETAAERAGEGAKDILFSFVFDTPKADGTSGTYARFELAFPKMPIGTRLEKAALKDKTTGWVALPSYGSAEKKDWTPVPTNLLGTLAETEKAGDLELLIEQTAQSDKTKQAVTKTLNDFFQNLLTPKPAEATDKK